MSFKASTSPKPLTAKSEAFAAIPSPMPPLSSPSSGAPSSEGEVLETPEPEPQRPARVTLRLDIRKAAEGRKILADLTNTNNRFKARLAADPYPISSMRSTANPNGYVGLKRNNRFKRSIATSFPPNEMATKITADRVDGMCKLLESTNMVDAPAATSTVEVPTVANTAALHTNKNRHRISAVTRAMRRSMFNVTVAKRGRAAGTFTMADKNKIAKSFETVFETPRLELSAKAAFPEECLTGVIYFAIQQYLIRANIPYEVIKCFKPAQGKCRVHVITPKSSLGNFENAVKEIIRSNLNLIATFPIPTKTTPIVPCWME